MRILIGSLGDLGYLVKPLPAPDGQPAWRRFEDERSLIGHLRGLSLTEPEIRGVFRSLRAQGRAVLALPDMGLDSPPPGRLPGRPAAARTSASG